MQLWLIDRPVCPVAIHLEAAPCAFIIDVDINVAGNRFVVFGRTLQGASNSQTSFL
jgi:hypothetical protein